MFSNKKEIYSIRKFKNGRSDSVKIGTIGLIMGAAIALSANTQSVEAAIVDNGDGTTTISNSKGSIKVETAKVKIVDNSLTYDENMVESKDFDRNPKPKETGTEEITKIGKADYKYVSTDGTVLEEDKNQDAGFEKQISVEYEVYGESGKIFKSLTGNEVNSVDLEKAKEHGAQGKETIEKDGTTYHKIGDPTVEITGDGGGTYSDTTLGNVTAKLTSEGLVQNDGKINYSGVRTGGRTWIVEETGNGTYGKYVVADTPATPSDTWIADTFKAGEATAKEYTSTNIAADGGIKEGDYVFVLEKNTFVTANVGTVSYTYVHNIPAPSSVKDTNGLYAFLNRNKENPDSISEPTSREMYNKYLTFLREKNLENKEENFKRFLALGYMDGDILREIREMADKALKGDTVDSENRPTSASEIVVEADGSNGGEEFSVNAILKRAYSESYSYKTELTPLRAYRLGSGNTAITYTYSPEKTSRVEKKGSVTVHYQTEDGTTLKDSYNDTVDAVVGVETKTYYLDANNQEVVVEDKTVKTPKNVAYNTKENETEKPQKLTDTAGNVYYLNEANTKTAVNDQETTSPAETGTVVEGKTEVTYVYEKAGSVIVNYQTEDGTPLVGTADGKDIASGVKDTVDGRPGSAYDTSDNGMKPTRITTAEGKVYELVPASTKGDETGKVVAGETKEVTYVYKEVKGNVVVKFEDTEGNKLADDEKDETDASLTTNYNTSEHKKATIIKDGVTYYLTDKALKDGSKSEEGNVVEGTTEVTYVYEKAGSVIVNYQTEDGTPLVGTADGKDIASGAKDTTDAKAGTDYNTADNGMKPSRITTAEGKVYELVEASTKGNETGKVVAGETKEVTYIYK